MFQIMEIPLLHYENIALDQFQSGSSLHFSFSDPKFFRRRSLSLFSGYCFQFSRRKWRNPLLHIKYSSVEQELKPRPKPVPSKIEVDEPKAAPLEDTQIVKRNSGLCSQIEKLVLCSRYREALELFEILEFEGGYELAGHTYDALVSACISLKSTSVDELSETLAELHHLRKETFRFQMSNAQTWLSAALTDDETCLDGIQEANVKAKAVDVKRKITNSARVTSNALYLINRLDKSSRWPRSGP